MQELHGMTHMRQFVICDKKDFDIVNEAIFET